MYGMSHPTLPLTEVRARLSPLLDKEVQKKGVVAISVHGKVRGYLVSAERLAELEQVERTSCGRNRSGRSRLRGSLEIVGDLEAGSRAAERELWASDEP